MRIGLLSETHGFLDDALITNFRECDEIWHASDLGTSQVIDQLNRLKPVRGVFGNVDGPEIRSRLPEDLEWCSENARVYMTHIGGYPGRSIRAPGANWSAANPTFYLRTFAHRACDAR